MATAAAYKGNRNATYRDALGLEGVALVVETDERCRNPQFCSYAIFLQRSGDDRNMGEADRPRDRQQPAGTDV